MGLEKHWEIDINESVLFCFVSFFASDQEKYSRLADKQRTLFCPLTVIVVTVVYACASQAVGGSQFAVSLLYINTCQLFLFPAPRRYPVSSII